MNSHRSWLPSYRIVAIAFVLWGAMTHSCQASIVTYDFQGVTTYIDPSSTTVPGDVFSGATFTGSFSFDTSAPGVNVSPNEVDYSGALTALSMKFSSTEYSKAQIDANPNLTGTPSNVMYVLNNWPGSSGTFIDEFEGDYRATDSLGNHFGLNFDFEIINSNPTALSTTVLGGDIIDPSKFFFRNLRYSNIDRAGNTTTYVAGVITSMSLEPASPVPEPSSLALLGMGCVGLFWRRAVRRKQAN